MLHNQRVKLKENEKDKYLELARELKKKLWNTKVNFIPIVIEALGTVAEEQLKGMEGFEI